MNDSKGSFCSVTLYLAKSIPGKSLITAHRIFSFSHVFNPKRSLCLSSRANETVSAIWCLSLGHNVRKICQAGFYESLLTAWNNNLMNRGVVFFLSLFFPSSESNRNKRVGAVNAEIVYSTLEQGQRTCHQPHPEDRSL